MPVGPPVIIVAPTVVRFTMKHTRADGHHMDNVVDISIDGQGVFSRATVMADFLAHVCGFWQDRMLTHMSTGTHFIGASWIDLDSATGGTGALGPAAGHPTAGVTPPPFSSAQVCYLVHKNSTSGRGQRQGRWYVPDVAEGNVDDNGNVTAGAITSITNEANQFRTDVGSYEYVVGSGIHPVALRTVHVHKPVRTDPTTWTWTSSTVDNVVCDGKVATQRRRLRS